MRGLSGGERKRTSIGLELITEPSLIFLDEPTTGLDSKSALNVASLLKMLAKNGRTVITTIHQPSSEILSRFDKIICLSKGKILYDGPPQNISGYFAQLGYPIPNLINPADYLMKIFNEDDIKIKAFEEGKDISKEEQELVFNERINFFSKKHELNKIVTDKMTCSDEEYNNLSLKVRKVSTIKQFWIIFSRAFKFYFRNPSSITFRIM